jgi:hypothetical protein
MLPEQGLHLTSIGQVEIVPNGIIQWGAAKSILARDIALGLDEVTYNSYVALTCSKMQRSSAVIISFVRMYTIRDKQSNLV